MNPHVYSSLAAFLAHYHLLSAAGRSSATSLSMDESNLLAAMDQALAALTADERAAIVADRTRNHATSAANRRRARAELKLRRLLAAGGLLQG